MHVLRLTSVFEPQAAALDRDAARFDPIGGMQNHTAALTRCLDTLGLRQTVLTSRLAAGTGAVRLGEHAVVRRTGLRTTRLRQLWALCALPHALRRSRGPSTSSTATRARTSRRWRSRSWPRRGTTARWS
jgi:hypothetical protein